VGGRESWEELKGGWKGGGEKRFILGFSFPFLGETSGNLKGLAERRGLKRKPLLKG